MGRNRHNTSGYQSQRKSRDLKGTLELLQIFTMTDQSQEHPTAGRRRRHKSPANIPSMRDLPLPRLVDHMAAEDGPSDAVEEEKEVKHYRSPSTTPRSTSGTLPHDYDVVMGIAPVERLGLRKEVTQISKTFKRIRATAHANLAVLPLTVPSALFFFLCRNRQFSNVSVTLSANNSV